MDTLEDEQTPQGPTDLEHTIRSRFMILATCGPCVELGDHIGKCMEFTTSNTVAITDIPSTNLVTWVPRNRVPILLISLGDACTAVFVQETGKCFYASETVALPHNIPAGCILMAHYTEDHGPEFRSPRVLIYDVVTWGSGTNRLQYVDVTTVNPHDRYRILREEFNPLLKHTDNTNTVLQWCGYVEGAREFLDGAMVVGHEVETLLELSTENALRPRLVTW
ncbi:hypothetical protein T484DRAFT_1754993 [Baffinella frigidus]|nr:hypothetical protein T484DRAFT_1754993 [Cryptophyta sp. CCMP2293]